MTDNLRQKLTEALESVIFPARGGINILGSDYTPTSNGIDAIMPVITEALAQAWDDGYRSCCIEPGWTEENNPWRQP